MNTALQLQDYIFQGMLSCDQFNMFNIVEERQFLMQSEVLFTAIWQTQRTDASGKPTPQAKVGAGIYIEMPVVDVPKPNSRQHYLKTSVLVLEERNMNLTPGVGTGMSSEDIAELVLGFLFGWTLSLSSALVPENAAITPALDIMNKEVGLMAYRVTVTLRVERPPQQRCDQPAIQQDADKNWIILNGANSPDATIYYTLDNSFPGRANPRAQIYAGPLTPAPGTTILACAWRQDLLPSHINMKATS